MKYNGPPTMGLVLDSVKDSLQIKNSKSDAIDDIFDLEIILERLWTPEGLRRELRAQEHHRSRLDYLIDATGEVASPRMVAKLLEKRTDCDNNIHIISLCLGAVERQLDLMAYGAQVTRDLEAD